MDTIKLKGFITDNGELKVDLPPDLPSGEVEVTIQPVEQPVAEQEELPWEERPWTEEEIREMLKPNPKTGAEIVALGHTGGWEHYGIKDSVEWIEEQRRKRREQRGW